MRANEILKKNAPTGVTLHVGNQHNKTKSAVQHTVTLWLPLFYKMQDLKLHLGCHTWWLRFYIGMPVVWTDRPSVYGHMISRMGRLPHFLTHGALLCRALRARAPLKPKVLFNIQ